MISEIKQTPNKEYRTPNNEVGKTSTFGVPSSIFDIQESLKKELSIHSPAMKKYIARVGVITNMPLILLLTIVGVITTMPQFLSAQKTKKPKLLAGPVIGAVTKNSAKIWIAFRGTGNYALILGDTSEKQIYKPTHYSYISNKKGETALTMDFTGLKPDHRYNIIISVEGWGAHAKYSFKTLADEEVKDFNFLLGSCNLLQTDITRGIFPGGSNWIFLRMKKKKPDLMVWLGDNIYYLYKKHYSSYEEMFKRNLKIRRLYNKFYRDYLANQPNYAIWDDHDYGPNDGDKNFALKDSALKVFKGFWPNKYPETESFIGNYFTFREYDAEFFMTDDRYYRDPQGDTAASFLGETQMIWLKNKLITSDAAFKFICVGTQVLNDVNFGEEYSAFPHERNDLLDFIAKNNIKGVIFLSGDKHYSEISKREWHGYPFYDYTSSPLTAPPLPRKLLGAYANSFRIKGSDYQKKNFGRISITGEKGNRVLKIETFGRAGGLRRTYTIQQNELEKK